MYMKIQPFWKEKIFKLCNFRPRTTCTSISQPQQEHPNPTYTPLPCSRTFLFLKDFLAFPRPHQTWVTLRQLFHVEYDWLTSWSDVLLLLSLLFSVRLQGSEFRRRMAHELHPGSVRGSVHMHGFSNCVMHGQTVCAQQPNIQELAERNKINMNLLLTKRLFLDNRVPIFQCFSFHFFSCQNLFVVKCMHARTLVISYLL